MKITWIKDSGASCHVTNNDSVLYDVTEIIDSIQGSSSILPATKKGKLWVKVRQVNGTEHVHTIWPVKFCPKAGVNLFYLLWELLQGSKISSDHQNNIVVNTATGNIILDCQIKIHDCWVTGAHFLWDSTNERAVSATALPKKNINDLHIELGHPSEAITRITTKTLGIEVTDMFKPCEDCALGKAEQQLVSKKAVPWSQILGEWLFFDIHSPSTLTFGGKHHWLLVIDDCSNYSWSFFVKEKSNLAETMLGLVKNLKIKFNLQVQCLSCNHAGKIMSSNKPAHNKG